MIHHRSLHLLLGFVLLAGCGSNSHNDELVPLVEQSNPSPTPANPVSQNLPTIMVLPSDAVLRRLGYMKTEGDGEKIVSREYQMALSSNKDLKFIIASIEGSFAAKGFPLENLEQQLKQLDNEAALDEVDDLQIDNRTRLLATARPDIVINLDYQDDLDKNSRNYRVTVSYSLTALDVYTNKSIAATARNSASDKDGNVSSIIVDDLVAALPAFQEQISKRFVDMLKQGAEITLRLSLAGDATADLGASRGGETFAEWLNDWLKANTVNSTYKSVRNTDRELRYTNVRIKIQIEGGKSFNAFDFAAKLRKSIQKDWNLIARNATQSIGDAYLIIQRSDTTRGPL